MAPTITRLVLSLALIVAAPVFYVIIFVGWLEMTSRSQDEIALLIASIVVGLGFAIGWLAIWLFEVRWNALRAAMTCVAFMASVGASVVIALLLALMTREEELGFLFGGMLFAVFYLLTTGLAWMELPAERRHRLASVGAGDVLCPSCGYNLRGLRVTACPECGASFTVDQLLAAQLERQKTLGDPSPGA